MSKTFRSVLEDRQTIREYWFAITLIYGGCDLISITPQDRSTEFCILCPQFDFEEYSKEFYAGQLQIADAQAFGKTATQVSRIIRDIRRNGQPYVNPDFDQMLRDEAERKSL